MRGYGRTNRQNTEPFARSIGTTSRFVWSEPGTLTQFVPRPTARPFVCACSCQPVWSAGQENRSCPGVLVALMATGADDVGRALTCAELVLSPPAFTALTTK